MEALLATVGLGLVMVLALTVLARAWVRSSTLGGYRTTEHGRDGVERGAHAPEDDDARWHWREPGDPER